MTLAPILLIFRIPTSKSSSWSPLKIIGPSLISTSRRSRTRVRNSDKLSLVIDRSTTRDSESDIDFLHDDKRIFECTPRNRQHDLQIISGVLIWDVTSKEAPIAILSWRGVNERRNDLLTKTIMSNI